MNKKRRKSIEGVISEIEDIQTRVNEIMEEEQEAYDNMPESLQETERGEAMVDAIDNMSCAYSDLENVIDSLNEVINN